MKKYRRLANLIASAAVIASVAAVPMSASAAGTTYSSTLTTENDKKTTTLDKYLVMKADANVPNAQFTFSVAPGTVIDADKTNGTLAVLAGIGTPVLSNGGTMTFSTADTTTAEAAKGTDTPVFVTADTSDEKYVKKTLTLDFSGVAFTEPGVYRYLITEAGTNQGITNGYVDASTTETVRTLDVYVEDAGTTVADGTDAGKPQLKITGYVMYNGTQTGAPKASAATPEATPNGAEVAGATKNDTITNVYSSQNLTFGKAVTGNQGSKDKYFKYTVEISNISAQNAKLSVDLAGADSAVPASPNAATKTEYAGKVNPAELIADTTKTIASNGYTAEAVTTGEAPDTVTTYKITAEYYLQHGQYITIQGLPEGASYSVTEDEEDYSQTQGIVQSLSTLNWNGEAGNDALADAVSGSIDDADIHTGYTNDRSGAIPTGILTTVAGSLGIVVFGIAGIAGGAAYLKKKKSEEE